MKRDYIIYDIHQSPCLVKKIMCWFVKCKIKYFEVKMFMKNLSTGKIEIYTLSKNIQVKNVQQFSN